MHLLEKNVHFFAPIAIPVLFLIEFQEANGELSMDNRTWSLKEFYVQFSDLYSWLNSVHEVLHGAGDNIETLVSVSTPVPFNFEIVTISFCSH